MAKAKLTKIGLKNFKSFGPDYQEIELSPLTVLLGRNNSGKSTIIQSLLLLKQTLAHPRSEVQLHLEGHVDALSLRELTHGWPSGDIQENGPEITIEWESVVDVEKALKTGARPLEREDLAEQSGIQWLKRHRGEISLTTTMTLIYSEMSSQIRIREINLRSRQTHYKNDRENPRVDLKWDEGNMRYNVFWWDRREPPSTPVGELTGELDHFLPYLQHARYIPWKPRAVSRGFRVLYEQPLEDLKAALLRLSYLGSTRVIPSSIYRPAGSPPDDVGISGEYAAQLLHARRSEEIHCLPPIRMPDEQGHVELPSTIRSLSLSDAVNQVFGELGVAAQFRLEDIKDVGFRLLFGRSSLQHVGRGISYLLPVVEAGLFADPLRNKPIGAQVPLDEYLKQCDSIAHTALEEPESHMHPKVQTLLAHFMVSLALSGRQILIETHSDHLVRRLRRLIARSTEGSETEQWLSRSVSIVEVEQGTDGITTLRQSKLTTAGAIAEHWPADFMDEASNEERSIYDAAMEKEARSAASARESYAKDTDFVTGSDGED